MEPVLLLIQAPLVAVELSPEQSDDVLLRPRTADLDETLPALTRCQWERCCAELRIALFEVLRQYTRRQPMELRARARLTFFPQEKARDDEQRAAILGAMTEAMPYGDKGMHSRIGFQRRCKAVLGELRDRLTWQFSLATGQIARPTPYRIVAVLEPAPAPAPAAATVATTPSAQMAAAVEGMLMLSSSAATEEGEVVKPKRRRRRRRPWSKT
jgi:hypothetical protein